MEAGRGSGPMGAAEGGNRPSAGAAVPVPVWWAPSEAGCGRPTGSGRRWPCSCCRPAAGRCGTGSARVSGAGPEKGLPHGEARRGRARTLPLGAGARAGPPRAARGGARESPLARAGGCGRAAALPRPLLCRPAPPRPARPAPGCAAPSRRCRFACRSRGAATAASRWAGLNAGRDGSRRSRGVPGFRGAAARLEEGTALRCTAAAGGTACSVSVLPEGFHSQTADISVCL